MKKYFTKRERERMRERERNKLREIGKEIVNERRKLVERREDYSVNKESFVSV